MVDVQLAKRWAGGKGGSAPRRKTDSSAGMAGREGPLWLKAAISPVVRFHGSLFWAGQEGDGNVFYPG